jgi:hypothetical protein
MTALVLAVVAAGVVLAVVAWIVRNGSPVQLGLSAAMLAALALAGVLLLTGDGAHTWDAGSRDALVLLAGGFAVAGGGPLTTSVLWLVDRGNPAKQSTQRAGDVLRGGALIGALERGAVYAALLAGWPEGIAVALAIKGLARYPELRSPDPQPTPVTPQAVAERFIIGTFLSVLWAVTCAGLMLS